MNLCIATAAVCAVLSSAPVASSEQQAAPKRDYVVNELSGFNVVLVVGESKGRGPGVETLPAAAVRALKEMGDFLPYKTYRVLDVQWISCCGTRASTTVSGRMQGSFELLADGKPVQAQVKYGFSITATSAFSNVPVRFVLTSEDGQDRRRTQGTNRELERERQDVEAETKTVEAQLREMQQRVEVGITPASEVRPLRDRYNSLQRRLADLAADLEAAAHGGAPPIIDSSFTMNAGETVVVGTSKFPVPADDKALIAVVTAVKKGAARE